MLQLWRCSGTESNYGALTARDKANASLRIRKRIAESQAVGERLQLVEAWWHWRRLIEQQGSSPRVQYITPAPASLTAQTVQSARQHRPIVPKLKGLGQTRAHTGLETDVRGLAVCFVTTDHSVTGK